MAAEKLRGYIELENWYIYIPSSILRMQNLMGPYMYTKLPYQARNRSIHLVQGRQKQNPLAYEHLESMHPVFD